jgi:tetratricopeptide (TPR) repeat protein
MSSSSTSEFEEGLKLLAERRWAAAIERLSGAQAVEPGRFAIVRALATAHLHKHDADAARQVLGDFVRDNSACAQGWRLAAQLEWKLGDYDAALALLDRGLDHLPKSPILIRQAALFRAARGEGQDRVEPGDAQPPQDPDWLDRVAQDTRLLESLLSLPDAPAADVAHREMLRQLELRLAQLLEAQPYHADRHLALARLQTALEDWPAAVLSVQRALRANPEYVQAHRLRATLLEKTGDIDAAIDSLQSLVARGIEWPDLHLQLARLQNRQGLEQDARDHVYTALRINPRLEEAHQLLQHWAA